VGRLLAVEPQLAYISEPLNVLHRPGVFRAKVAHWYTYICKDNEQHYLQSFLETLAYRYQLSAELASIRSMRDILRMGRDLAALPARVSAAVFPLKDPFAVFSLAWLQRR